jgi:hypothetical protein
MGMSIQDWGAIGEIVGAIGVIASLIYLASQIRLSNKHAASASLQGMAERAEARMLSMAINPQLADLHKRWLSNDELDENEILRATAWFMTWLTDVEECYRQANIGLIPTSALRTRLKNIVQLMESRYAYQTWEQMRSLMDPDFVAWFTSELPRHDA